MPVLLSAPMPLSRAETEAQYQRHRAIHEEGDWPRLADLFAPDAFYVDPFFGRTEGREAIRAFLERSMAGLEDWTFPFDFIAITEGRVVTAWRNRLPRRRRDGTPFEFRGMSTMTYADDGQIQSQVDLYDRLSALQTIAEAQLPGAEWTMHRLRQLADPVTSMLHRIAAR